MSSMLTSQGLVLATAMAVSAGTIILFDFFREKYFTSSPIPESKDSPAHEKQVLKSCLSSGRKKREKGGKKRVQFADDVKDSSGNSNGELCRKENRKLAEIQSTSSCGNEILGFQKMQMPANHAALYSGILKNRVHRMEYSY